MFRAVPVLYFGQINRPSHLKYPPLYQHERSVKINQKLVDIFNNALVLISRINRVQCEPLIHEYLVPLPVRDFFQIF
jgi:hypothetical protein